MKKKVIWAVISLVLAVLTIYAVFSVSGEITPAQIFEVLKSPTGGWIIPAILGTVGFIYFEGRAYMIILRAIGYPQRERRGFLYSSADVYFSAITPSATGGQPAIAFFMMNDGIPGSLVTAIVIFTSMLYAFALLAISAVCVIAMPDVFTVFSSFARGLLIFGIIMISALCTFTLLFLVKSDLLFNWSTRFVNFVNRGKLFKIPQGALKRLETAKVEYAGCITIIKEHKSLIAKVFFTEILQRLSQFSVILFTYLAIGGDFRNLPRLFVIHDLVTIGSFGIPIPGAMGATEYLMIDGYGSLMPPAQAFTLELLGRGVSFYICIAISAAVLIIGYASIRRQKKLKEMEKQLSEYKENNN